MKYTFYYFVIFSVFANLHVKALPTKDEAGTSNGQIVNSLADQMEKVLKKGEYSDVQFLVGKDNKKEMENWSHECSVTLRIVSQKNGTEDLIGRFNGHIFNEKKNNYGYRFISFAELMDPSKGFYNKDEDKLKLAIDVIVEEPKTDKFFSDPNKSIGTLSMEIEKLSEFAREIIGSERKSETLYIKGMPWKILAQIKTKNENNEKWLGFFILCNTSEKALYWSRACSSATFRIVSQRDGVEDFMREFNETKVFNNNTSSHGWNNFISFAELMDPSKGLYNKDEDKVTLAIDVSAKKWPEISQSPNVPKTFRRNVKCQFCRINRPNLRQM
ncbi:hypothetical protein niasHT_016923 [Heterodera trifolii]|uniref:MATH domain-containing protein n=1 Tax=Heterodera trifolii TaxID=157864 RepID=A0ABD2L3B1_9BILA